MQEGAAPRIPFIQTVACFSEQAAVFSFIFSREGGNTLSFENGVSMHQARFDSLVGRLGLRLDRKLASENGAALYVKADVLHEFSGKQKVHFSHPTLGADGLDAEIGNKGTWYDVGVGGSWNIDRDCILSADAEYRFGHGLGRSFGLNVGVRWNF